MFKKGLINFRNVLKHFDCIYGGKEKDNKKALLQNKEVKALSYPNVNKSTH